MSTSVGEVVAHLLAARDRLAVAAVTASRARADADQALAHYREAARGSDHAKIRSVIAAVGVAGAKSDRVARLISEIREHITAYVNHIAPGAAPTDNNAPDALPDGDRLATEAESRGRRGEAFLRAEVKNAGDREDALKQVEKLVTDGARGWSRLLKDGPGPTQTEIRHSPSVDHQENRPQLDNPVTSTVMAIAAIAVGVKGISNSRKKRRERQDDGH